ncbi:unnamed protein product [Eretmochelys imbricata]
MCLPHESFFIFRKYLTMYSFPPVFERLRMRFQEKKTPFCPTSHNSKYSVWVFLELPKFHGTPVEQLFWKQVPHLFGPFFLQIPPLSSSAFHNSLRFQGLLSNLIFNYKIKL